MSWCPRLPLVHPGAGLRLNFQLTVKDLPLVFGYPHHMADAVPSTTL